MTGKPKVFYGYIVLAAGFIASLLTWGTYNSFGVFLKPLASELTLTRETTSAVYSMALIISGIFGMGAGRLSDKFGPKVVLVAGGLLTGLGYLLVSQASSIWQLYLFYGLILGIGLSSIDTPVLSTIARWFVKKRGMATGIAKVGVGLGILVISPLAGWLVSGYGWRSAFLVIGILSLLGIVSSGWLLKRDPRQIGQLPDGTTQIEETSSITSQPQFSVLKAIGTRQFWLFSAVWFITAFCAMTVLGHTAAYATDLGISTTVASAILGAIGGFSILGRLGMGSVSDKMGNKSVFIISTSLMAISLLWLQFAKNEWMLFLFAAVYGIAHGALFTAVTPMLAELFGVESLGAIAGIVIFIGRIGGAIGPTLAGRIFDVTGSYHIAFLICLMLSITGVLLIYFVKPTEPGKHGTTT